MKTNSKTKLIFFCILLSISCNKKAVDPITPPVKTPVKPSTEKDLTSFAINFKSFSGENIVATGKKTGNNFSIFLPPNIDYKTIKPTFVISDKAKILIDNVAQVSNESLIDLNKPITYTVEAEDKTSQAFTISPIIINAPIDKIINDFMGKYSVTGLTFSISNKEKLVYSKGYGIANKVTNEAVTVNSLFRIASVSKPITSIAIMKLVEEKKISLDDKVFGDNSIFGNKYGGKPYRTGYENITIKQILEHTSGLPTNDGNDPMFDDFNLTHDQIIENTVKNRDLYTTPGSKYAYSNFGFCVLGRVIEKVSGQSYESYLQKNIFNPIGITKMQVTGNSINTKKANEVVYYNSQYDPYYFNVARMDSHGGLVASSIDLVKLISRVDGNNVKPDILNSTSVAQMTKYNATTGYSLGWSVNANNNWWHNGNITGTSSEMVRANNGFSWAIVVNYGCVGCKDNFFNELDGLGWQVIAATKDWPEYDLF